MGAFGLYFEGDVVDQQTGVVLESRQGKGGKKQLWTR